MSGSATASGSVAALPSCIFFEQLLKAASAHNGNIIYDTGHGIEASFKQLLSDVIAFKQKIRNFLPAEIMDGNGIIRENEDVYMCTWLTPGYKFFVSYLAISAMGAIAAPMGKYSFYGATGVPLERTRYFVSQCKAALFVVDHKFAELASGIRNQIKLETGRDVRILSAEDIDVNASPSFDPYIDRNVVFPLDRPSLLLCTTGTTGEPKCILHSLCWYRIEQASPLNTDPTELFMFPNSVHVAMTLQRSLENMLRAIPIRTLSPESGPDGTWEAICEYRPSITVGVVGFWYELMKYFNENIASLPTEERDQYIKGARCLKHPICGGAAPAPSLKRFWKQLLGVPLKVGYGSTELSTVTLIEDVDFTNKPSIGKPLPHIDIKLSGGDRGEMLVKTPTAFLKYLDNEAATRAAFDSDGYYRTGDQCYVENGIYFIEGRTSHDFIRVSNLNIGVLELEGSLLELPYIMEAYILPVQDLVTGQRVAAILRSRLPFLNVHGSSEVSGDVLTFQRLRADLHSNGISKDKLPTILRVLSDDEKMPVSPTTFKPLKREASKLFFPQSKEGLVETLPPEVQVWRTDES